MRNNMEKNVDNGYLKKETEIGKMETRIFGNKGGVESKMD